MTAELVRQEPHTVMRFVEGLEMEEWEERKAKSLLMGDIVSEE